MKLSGDAVRQTAQGSTTRTTITLLLPVLNEIDGLRATLPYINRSLFDEILMVDGGSTDGSVEYARAEGIQVTHQKRPGLAWAVFDAVSQLQTKYVIQFSPDGNCPVECLPDLVEALNQDYDMVVVSRYLPPAKSEDDNLVTAVGNWVFTQMTAWLGRARVTDSLTGYRGYRCSLVSSYDFAHYLKGPVLEPLLSAICNLHGLKIHEIPGSEPKRIGGVSKMRPLYNGSCVLLMLCRMYVKKIFGWKL